jgi:competence protein ComEA
LAAEPHRLPAISTKDSHDAGSGEPMAQFSPGGSLKSPIATSSAAGTELVVDVVGKVRQPGVYRLPPGSRVNDAVVAAGGVTPGVSPASLNRARKLVDGEQVAVGLAGSGGPAVADTGNAGRSGTAGGLIDLNAATLTQLDSLPGVGPVLAQRILDWRTAHGRFASADQLRSVSGIGDAKYSDLKQLVTAS